MKVKQSTNTKIKWSLMSICFRGVVCTDLIIASYIV
jgi:hypothetical protein